MRLAAGYPLRRPHRRSSVTDEVTGEREADVEVPLPSYPLGLPVVNAPFGCTVPLWLQWFWRQQVESLVQSSSPSLLLQSALGKAFPYNALTLSWITGIVFTVTFLCKKWKEKKRRIPEQVCIWRNNLTWVPNFCMLTGLVWTHRRNQSNFHAACG